MRCEDFSASWDRAIQTAGLRLTPTHVHEQLELPSLTRVFRSSVPLPSADAAPFDVHAALEWRWDALHTARTATTEEDLLTAVLGREPQRLRTVRPWLRVDVELHARLPWGRDLPLPAPDAWARWAREAIGRLASIEPVVPAETTRRGSDGRVEYLAWQGLPEVDVTCTADGELRLRGVRVASWQAIELPRVWDDPERPVDTGTGDQLHALFTRVRRALLAWSEACDHLDARG